MRSWKFGIMMRKVDPLGPKDVESQMIVKLRRFYKRINNGDSEELEELKIILRHHLQQDMVQPGTEFQEVFDALVSKKKISLGAYDFLIATLSNIHDEAVNILTEYQTKITTLVDTLSPEDMESQMIVKLRRFYKRTNSGDTDELEELKIILRHHLQPDLVGAEKEFQEIFESLVKKKKIVLGNYEFLIATLSNIHYKAVNILKEYQTKITNLGSKEWHGIKVADDQVERQIENKMKDINIDISSIAEEHISQFKSEVSKYRLHKLNEAQYASEQNHK